MDGQISLRGTVHDILGIWLLFIRPSEDHTPTDLTDFGFSSSNIFLFCELYTQREKMVNVHKTLQHYKFNIFIKFVCVCVCV